MVGAAKSLLWITLMGLSSSTKLSSSSLSSATSSDSFSATSSSLSSSFSLVETRSDLLLELNTEAKLALLEKLLPETLRLDEIVVWRRKLRLCEDEDREALLCSSCRLKAGATRELSDESELPEDRDRSLFCCEVLNEPPLPVEEYERPIPWPLRTLRFLRGSRRGLLAESERPYAIVSAWYLSCFCSVPLAWGILWKSYVDMQ